MERNSSQYYKMDNPKRGFAVIFNHEFFKHHKRRRGTIHDSNGLKNVLTSLGYTVMVFHDSSLDLILRRLEQIRNMNHAACDSLLIAVLTHGEMGTLTAYDSEYNVEVLWKYFTAESCPGLAGKPKIFIIQACRGSDVDDGITMYSQTDSAVEITRETSSICTEPDMLFAYSSIPGYYSFRNIEKGSCFIQSLIKILEEYGTKEHILSIFTKVNLEMALVFESNVPQFKALDKKRTIASIDFTLTRLLTFK